MVKILIYPDGAVKEISYLFFYPPERDEGESFGAYVIWERMEDGLFCFHPPALQWLRIDD